MKEAEANKEEDKKRKEEADVKNEAEQLVFQTEKTIKDLGDKVESSEKEEVEKLIKDLKEALDKNDIEDIKSKKDKLQEKAMALATKLYENVKPENSEAEPETNTTNETKKDDVSDAEYEEK